MISCHIQPSIVDRRAIQTGLWDSILAHLISKTCKEANRNVNPSYAIVDSQSSKTVYASEERGIDGEKTKGRKRHIVVDTMGNLLSIVVHAANIHDTKAGIVTAKTAVEKISIHSNVLYRFRLSWHIYIRCKNITQARSRYFCKNQAALLGKVVLALGC